MAKKITDNKQRIHTTAQNLFREKGYSATSMRDLATAVGVEAATLYSHIKSKEEILQHICFTMADQLFDAFDKGISINAPADKKLMRVIEAHLMVIANNNNASAVFFHDWRHMSEPFLNDFKLMRRRYENGFVRIIEEGIQEGIFRNVNVKFTVLTLFSAMNWTYDIPGKKLHPHDVAQQLCELLFNGLLKKTSK